MNFELILKYSEYLTSPEDEILVQLRRETNLKTLFPRMISGPLQGKFLEFVSRIYMPKTILEIGTYTGYSTICLARGLAPNGQIYTIEINDELEPIISKYLKKSNLFEKVNLLFGDAKRIIPNLKIMFDLVFIDADKKNYLNYYKLIFDKVKVGGLILVDNIFWNGKIFKPLEPSDTYTKGILEFNEFIVKDNRVERLVLPLRDGLLILRKLKN